MSYSSVCLRYLTVVLVLRALFDAGEVTSHDVASHDATSHDATRHDAANYDVMSRHDAASHDASSYDAMSHDATSHGRVRRHGESQCGGAQSGQVSNSNGTSCSGNITTKQVKRNYRLDMIKDDILRKLRMTEPPNVTGRVPDVPAIQTWISTIGRNESNGSMLWNHDDVDPDPAEQTTVLLLSQPVPTGRASSFPNTCYFRLSRELNNDHLISAQLGVYLRPRSLLARVSHGLGSTGYTWILIYTISRSPRTNRFERTLQRKRRIPLTATDNLNGKRYIFDVKNIVENWTRDDDMNYGIQIIASDNTGEPLAVMPNASNETWNDRRPYIELVVRNHQSTPRTRRSNEMDCVEASSETRCCRYPLTIDFEAFRWDWIIAPKHYEAYYCSGECPFLYYQQRHGHTHLLQQRSGVPCCAPTLMSSLSMVYTDSNLNVVFGTLPGMVVERCGCS